MNEESNLDDGFIGHDYSAGFDGAGHQTLPQNKVHVGERGNHRTVVYRVFSQEGFSALPKPSLKHKMEGVIFSVR